MNKSPQSLKVKEKSAFSLSDLATKTESVLLALLFLLLPTQLGKHFWPQFSLVGGIRVDYLSPTLYVTDILIGLLFFLFISRNRFTFSTTSRRYLLLWLSICCFVGINILYSDRQLLSGYYALKFFEYTFLAYYIAKTITSRSQVISIAIITSIAVFFESCLAILQYLNQASLDGWLYYFGERTFNGATVGIANAAINGELLLRPYGTFSHPNVLSGYLLLSTVFIYFFQIRWTSGFIKWFGIIVLCLASVAILISLSRVVIGIWVLLVLSLILYQVIIRLRSVHAIILGVLSVAILLSIGFVSPLGQTLSSRFIQTSFSEEALVQRTELIQNSLIIIQSHPFIGVGFGNFIPALSPLQEPLSIGLYLQPVHNIYLLVASEAGLLGLAFFVLMIVVTYKRLLQNVQRPLFRIEFFVITLLLTLLLIIGCFDHYFLTLQQGQLLFALIIGFSWISLTQRP